MYEEEKVKHNTHTHTHSDKQRNEKQRLNGNGINSRQLCERWMNFFQNKYSLQVILGKNRILKPSITGQKHHTHTDTHTPRQRERMKND